MGLGSALPGRPPCKKRADNSLAAVFFFSFYSPFVALPMLLKLCGAHLIHLVISNYCSDKYILATSSLTLSDAVSSFSFIKQPFQKTYL